MDYVVFKGNNSVVSKKLRSEMLNLIHFNHQGVGKCKTKAREIMYWPLMNKEIEDIVLSCHICDKYKKSKVREPLMPRNAPHGPWQMMGMDLFHYKGFEHLLIIDYFSKFVEVVKLQSIDVSNVIKF